jgi:SAM-dependent methyltransferase
MSDFSHDWLALREPADRLARDPGLLDAAVEYLRAGREPAVTDLGCGTGSTLRTMASRLPATQRWRLVDHSPALLDRALESLPPEAGRDRVEAVVADLDRDLERVLAEPAALVTLSAFLDLVSLAWIDRLAREAARLRAGVYAALNYDGRSGCEPFDALDPQVLEAFNAHQRRDKGLGSALGPRAAEVAAESLRSAGFEVQVARADWRVDPDMAELQRQLLAGWVAAVAETGRVEARALAGWHERRLGQIERKTLRLVVGHLDVLALPAAHAASR